jgi:DNA processing protein
MAPKRESGRRHKVANKPALRLTDQQRFDWLRLIRSENVGPRTFRALVTNCGGVGAALKALPEIARRGGAKRSIRIASAEEIEKELIAARRVGVRFVALGEPDYPPALQEIDSAPPILALRGRAEVLRKAAVAIVGSRNASAAGLTFAERLARGLGQAGYVVVSGLARGIDQRAHVASLETGTVGVLAGGHGKPYPSEAVPLMERMVEAGAVLSEMPVEWEPRGRDFPRRNRIVSGLALGVVVVEAARGSGSLITARFALEQNRQIFAVPGSPLDPRAHGTNDLLKQGASICTDMDDVVTALEQVRSDTLPFMREASSEPGEPLWGEQELYGVDPQSTPRTRVGDEFDDAAGAPYQTGDEAEVARERILALLGPSPITLDELARAAEAPARTVRVALLELEVAGRIEYSGDRVALRPAVNEA